MSEMQLKQVDYVPAADGSYEVVSGEPTNLQGLHLSTIDYDELVKRLEDGNETYSVSPGPSGRRYESIIFNSGLLQKGDAPVICKPSTSFSSGYKNPANVLETALAATANPNAIYVYLASFGNYPTQPMDPTDLRYVAKTGRYTTGNGAPGKPYAALPSVEDMAEALANRNITPTHFSADEEAGRLALALMSAYPSGTIRGAYLNGLDGLSPTAKYFRSQFSDDMKSRIHRRGITDSQPGELTPVNIKDIKKRMPTIYKGLGQIAHIAPLPVLLFPKDDWSKLQVSRGFRKHKDMQHLEDHAVFQDMRAALLRQNAPLTMQFNTESNIHDLQECIKFGRMAMASVPENMRTEERKVRLIIGEGDHNRHTDQPHSRTRVEQYAFPDIMHKMAALAGLGAGLLDKHIFDLKPLEEAA